MAVPPADPAAPGDRAPAGAPARRRPRVPRPVWVLGLVSLCMDVSSEMIHGLLPVFLVSVLGAGPFVLGAMEGIAEGAASLVKLGSGAVSDRMGRRKPLAVAGYGLSALSKPLFAIAPAVGWVFGARLMDRLGKGIRGAPRDALIGDLTPPQVRGAAYGLRQSLDTVGAVLGPLTAVALMAATGDDVRAVFVFASLPALAAVALLALAVREPPRPPAAPAPAHADASAMAAARVPWRALGAAFWSLVLVSTLHTLARFSEAFLILRAQDGGLALGRVPLVLVVMNGVYALAAYPIGRRSDRVGRRRLLAGGLAVLVAADAVLARADGLAAIGVGVALWGLHLGMTQGLFAALVAEAVPAAARGTAFGIFHATAGIATIAASLAAGALWQAFGAPAPFAASAALAALALLALAALPALRSLGDARAQG